MITSSYLGRYGRRGTFARVLPDSSLRLPDRKTIFPPNRP